MKLFTKIIYMVIGMAIFVANTAQAESGVHQYIRSAGYNENMQFVENKKPVKFDNSKLERSYFWNNFSKTKVKFTLKEDTFDMLAHKGTYFWGYYNN